MEIRTLIDHLQEIFYTLEKNKLRTVLTGLTVSWGIFMLILLLGSGYGLENGVHNAFQEDAANSIWIRPGQTSIPYKGLNQGRHVILQNPDTEELQKKISQKEFLSGRFYLGNDTIVRFKQKFGKFQVIGVQPDYMKIEHAIAVQGRPLNQLDEKRVGKVAVIGIEVKKELFKNQTPVNKYILIKGVPFHIVGVFDDPQDRWNLDRIYIPMTTMQKVFNKNDRVHNIAMTIHAKDEANARVVENEIREILAKRHRFSIKDNRALFTHNTLIEYTKLMDLFANIRVFIWIIGIGSIVAGIVSISNIMLITVKERTREIGIRKALGATPRSVILMILAESVMITFGFGYFGLVGGIGVLEIMGKLITSVAYFKNPQINITVAFGALMVLVISGALAGIFPARHAATIRPAEALRDE